MGAIDVYDVHVHMTDNYVNIHVDGYYSVSYYRDSVADAIADYIELMLSGDIKVQRGYVA